MAAPFALAMRGHFVIIGKQPDGDSVRFIADDPELFQAIHRGDRVKLSSVDGSVQLRFEGVDAPELHYGAAAQPLGKEARDQLLTWLGFTQVHYASPTSNTVSASTPEQIPGVILTKAAETHGRLISYVLTAQDAGSIRDGRWVRVGTALLRKTINLRQIEAGMTYYTVYTSTPLEHRRVLRRAAAEARSARQGVWARDTTGAFELDTQDDISPTGQLILPKLFRRCTDYLKAVDRGFEGNLSDWLIAHTEGSRLENDQLLLPGNVEVRALITVRATSPSVYPSARCGGLRGAGGRSTEAKIAANIDRGF